MERNAETMKHRLITQPPEFSPGAAPKTLGKIKIDENESRTLDSMLVMIFEMMKKRVDAKQAIAASLKQNESVWKEYDWGYDAVGVFKKVKELFDASLKEKILQLSPGGDLSLDDFLELKDE